jgi:hypothetical protein
MAAMALGGCKRGNKSANVKDEDFEKTGYWIDDTEWTYYYYVVKNNSKKTVAILGTAKACSSDGTILEENIRDIPVLGPGETSIMEFLFQRSINSIYTIDCDLQYFKTDLTPVIGDIRTECLRSEDEFTVLVTNESDVEVTDLKGIVLYFDSENTMIAAGEEDLRVHQNSYPHIMKPGVSMSMMFTPHNHRTIKHAGYEYTDYDHAEVYLKYLDRPPTDSDFQRRSQPFIDVPEGILEVKEISCKNTAGYQIHCLVVKNISDKVIGVHGVMKAYDAGGRALTALTSTVDALGIGEETILPFEFDVFDPITNLWPNYYAKEYTATDAIKNADHVAYQLKYDPLPDKTPLDYSVKVIDYELDERNFKEVLVTYNGDGTIGRPKVYGVFYNAEGNVVFAGYALKNGFNGGRSGEFVVKDWLENGDTVIYGFAWDSRWLRDKETESFRPMKKYDRADIYILED